MFCNVYGFAAKFYFDNDAEFFPNFIMFSNNFSSLNNKDTHLLLTASLLYALTFRRNMYKELLF